MLPTGAAVTSDVFQPRLDHRNVRYFTEAQLQLIAEHPTEVDKVFVRISREDILHARRMHYASTIAAFLRGVQEASNSFALGGGVLFLQDNKVVGEQESRVAEEAWHKWFRQLDASIMDFGIAACTIADAPPPLHGIPRVLDLEHIELRMYTDGYDHRTYAAYEPPMETTAMEAPEKLAAQSSKLFPIKGLMVFEVDPPGRDGRLRSKIISLKPDVDYYEMLAAMNARILARIEHPRVLTEHVESKINAEKEAAWVSVAPTNPMDANPLVRPLTKEQKRAREAVNDEILSARPSDPTYSLYTERERCRLQRLSYEESPLPEGRKVGTTVTAQQMKEFPEYQAMLEDRICGIYGVPRAMLTQGTRNRSSTNEDNKEVFLANQRYKKQIYLAFANKMYDLIYGEPEARKKLEMVISMGIHVDSVTTGGGGGGSGTTPPPPPATPSSDPKEPSSATTSSSSTSTSSPPSSEAYAAFSVNLPGVPPLEILQVLRQEGTLKYEAYRMLVSKYTILPRCYFNEEPELTLQEQLGIKEDPGTTTVSTTEATQNAKTGSAVKKGQTTSTSNERYTGAGGIHDKEQKRKNKPLDMSGTLGARNKRKKQ